MTVRLLRGRPGVRRNAGNARYAAIRALPGASYHRVDGATERLNLPVGELLIELVDEVTAHPDASGRRDVQRVAVVALPPANHLRFKNASRGRHIANAPGRDARFQAGGVRAPPRPVETRSRIATASDIRLGCWRVVAGITPRGRHASQTPQRRQGAAASPAGRRRQRRGLAFPPNVAMVAGMEASSAATLSAPAECCHMPSHVPSGAALLALELSEEARGIRGLDLLRRSVDRAPPTRS